MDLEKNEFEISQLKCSMSTLITSPRFLGSSFSIPFSKAWFPLQGKRHDHDTETKQLLGRAVILHTNRFVDSKLVVVVVVIGLMETRLEENN